MVALFRDAERCKVSLRNQGITGAAAETWISTARARLKEDLGSPARQLVISGETMSSFETADFERLRDAIAPHTRAIRVLAYLRDPLGFASSMFQQMVKNGQKTFSVPDLKYRPRLEPALRVFGLDAVDVVMFDKDTLPGGDVITDFCARIGIDRSRLTNKIANERLSAATIGLIYGFNQLAESKIGTKARFRARYALIERLAVALPGKLRLDPDLVRKRVDPADLDWLAETWGVDFRPGLLSAAHEADDIGNLSDLMAARESARPALEQMAARRLIRSRGRDIDDIMLRLYKSQITRETLKGLVRRQR
jgi:hypothetical protein